MTTIREKISHWDKENIANLATIIDLKESERSVDKIEERIKWLYHSSTLEKGKTILSDVFSKAFGSKPTDYHQEKLLPSYDELIIEAAKSLKVYKNKPAINKCELYISHAVLIEALNKMSAEQRTEFFNKPIGLEEIVDKAGIKNTSYKGPATTLVAIQLAGVGGFSTYLAATSALGFVTHAVGITLPFAAYTGLSSTIAFAIGPVGFIGVALWAGWKLLGAEWKKLIPALLYIISTNTFLEMQAKS